MAACRIVSYGAQNVPDCVCVCVPCVVLRESQCDFSKEQFSSLEMILGSKHVGAISNVLM